LSNFIGYGIRHWASGCTSTVLINSKPSGAKVYLDNQEVGVTPVKAKVSTGTKGNTHTLILENDGQRYKAELKNETITTFNLVTSILFWAPVIIWQWQPGKENYTFDLAELQ